jgi:hypothetical protein
MVPVVIGRQRSGYSGSARRVYGYHDGSHTPFKDDCESTVMYCIAAYNPIKKAIEQIQHALLGKKHYLVKSLLMLMLEG